MTADEDDARKKVPKPATSTDDLVRHAQAGDVERFGRLYARVAPSIHAWACLHVRREARGRVDPEDVMQEVWVRAMAKFARFNPVERPFRAWIFAIARNVVLEGVRKASSMPRTGSSAEDPAGRSPIDSAASPARSITRNAASREAVRAFLEEVEHLSGEERALVIHCGFEGQSLEEVAKLLGCSREAVKKRWQRLRSRLLSDGRFLDLFEDA